MFGESCQLLVAALVASILAACSTEKSGPELSAEARDIAIDTSTSGLLDLQDSRIVGTIAAGQMTLTVQARYRGTAHDAALDRILFRSSRGGEDAFIYRDEIHIFIAKVKAARETIARWDAEDVHQGSFRFENQRGDLVCAIMRFNDSTLALIRTKPDAAVVPEDLAKARDVLTELEDLLYLAARLLDSLAASRPMIIQK